MYRSKQMFNLYLVLFVFIGVSLTGQYVINQGKSGDDAPPSQVLATPVDCDAAQTACTAEGEGLRLHLQLGPGVRALKPFRSLLAIEGVAPEKVLDVEIEFVMRDMDMGVNRYRLLWEEGRWVAEAVLPVCLAGRSDWVAELRLLTEDGAMRADFPFQVPGGSGAD